jgi:hypothetical protein
MKTDNRGRRYIRKTKQRLTNVFAYVSIYRNCSECLASLRQPCLMVFRDVDAGFAEERSHTTDYTRDVIVGKNQQGITRLDIDVKRTDS